MIVLIKLVLAHLLGDFLLQPNSWVRAKESKKIRAWQLYIHSLIHFALILLLIWDLSFLKWAILLAVIHLLTDTIKLYAQTSATKRKWFFIDQSLHLIVVFIVWTLSQSISFHIPVEADLNFFLLITLGYALTHPVSVVIRFIMSKWSPPVEDLNSGSLANAGSYIGMLERLLVFTFILTGHWEAIGFLVAAKSVFRFGDLKESKDRKLTEYVLIGTLLSFGIAIAAGVTFNILLGFN